MAPRWLVYALVLLAVLALVPFALIARSRASTSTRPHIQLIQDMARQPKLKTQAANPLFADGRTMRPSVAGTVARGELEENSAYWTGREDGAWVTTFPVPVTEKAIPQDASAKPHVPSQEEVVENSHVPEELHVLEGAADAHPGDVVGFLAGDFLFLKKDSTFLGAVNPVNAIQERGFARSIRPYDGQEFPFAHPQGDLPEGLDSPEMEVEIFDL